MAKLTQVQKVLRHLRNVGPINPGQALNEYAIFRLAAVVHILRGEGHNIETEIIKTNNRFGEPCHYARYTLNPPVNGIQSQLNFNS